MSRPEYPTSIRLTVVDKRRLRKWAASYNHSLAGLIQMILLHWLTAQEQAAAVVVGERQEKKNDDENGADSNDDQRPGGSPTLPQAGS